jgi:hypothetical protein
LLCSPGLHRQRNRHSVRLQKLTLPKLIGREVYSWNVGNTLFNILFLRNFHPKCFTRPTLFSICEQVNICVLVLLWSALEETPYNNYLKSNTRESFTANIKMIPLNSFNSFTLEEKQKLLLELRLGRVLVDGECWCEPNENNFSILSQCLYPCILSSAFSTFNT